MVKKKTGTSELLGQTPLRLIWKHLHFNIPGSDFSVRESFSPDNICPSLLKSRAAISHYYIANSYAFMYSMYFSLPHEGINTSNISFDVKTQQELWDATMKVTGVYSGSSKIDNICENCGSDTVLKLIQQNLKWIVVQNKEAFLSTLLLFSLSKHFLLPSHCDKKKELHPTPQRRRYAPVPVKSTFRESIEVKRRILEFKKSWKLVLLWSPKTTITVLLMVDWEQQLLPK